MSDGMVVYVRFRRAVVSVEQRVGKCLPAAAQLLLLLISFQLHTPSSLTLTSAGSRNAYQKDRREHSPSSLYHPPVCSSLAIRSTAVE